MVGNTRVISQKALDHFRTSLAGKKDDPYSVLLRRNKLPMALLDDASNPNLRKVSFILIGYPCSDESYRDHTSSKPSPLAKHSDRKPSARNPDSTLAHSKSSENSVSRQKLLNRQRKLSPSLHRKLQRLPPQTWLYRRSKPISSSTFSQKAHPDESTENSTKSSIHPT